MTAVPNPLAGYANDVAPSPADPSAAVARLNALLRGELSAAETYRSLLARLAAEGHATHVPALESMLAEHDRSASALRGRVEDLGGSPADGSGVWGVWSHAVQSTLTLFAGDAGGLRALREGEEHGLRDYESALNGVDGTSAQLIQDRLMPAQQKHLVTLDHILAVEESR